MVSIFLSLWSINPLQAILGTLQLINQRKELLGLQLQVDCLVLQLEVETDEGRPNIFTVTGCCCHWKWLCMITIATTGMNSAATNLLQTKSGSSIQPCCVYVVFQVRYLVWVIATNYTIDIFCRSSVVSLCKHRQCSGMSISIDHIWINKWWLMDILVMIDDDNKLIWAQSQ